MTRAFDLFDDLNGQDQLFAMRNKALVKQNFEEVESTSEYAETHYFKNTGSNTNFNVN